MSSIRKSMRRPSRCNNASTCVAVASSTGGVATFAAGCGAPPLATGVAIGAAAVAVSDAGRDVLISAAATSGGMWSRNRTAKNVLNANLSRVKKGVIVGTAQLARGHKCQIVLCPCALYARLAPKHRQSRPMQGNCQHIARCTRTTRDDDDAIVL